MPPVLALLPRCWPHWGLRRPLDRHWLHRRDKHATPGTSWRARFIIRSDFTLPESASSRRAGLDAHADPYTSGVRAVDHAAECGAVPAWATGRAWGSVRLHRRMMAIRWLKRRAHLQSNPG